MPRRLHSMILVLLCALLLIGTPVASSTVNRPADQARELATFAAPECVGQCGSGSTVGPDRALYVTDGPGGRVLRIDRRTGAVRTIATGLPRLVPAVGIGGAVDVAFRGRTAYVLVTLVGPSVGQPGVVAGIYRVASDGGTSVLADIGAWSAAHPPATTFVVPSGVQYALQPYRHGFLVTDGHHNRVLYVTLAGQITEVRAFGNVAPTGLAVHRGRIVMAEAGPVPHRPATGRVITWRPNGATTLVLASGAALAVDVEVGAHADVWVLSQGFWDHPNVPENAGLPAAPGTGALFRVDRAGKLITMAAGLDRPTSLELVGDDAYVVTLTGKVLRLGAVRQLDR